MGRFWYGVVVLLAACRGAADELPFSGEGDAAAGAVSAAAAEPASPEGGGASQTVDVNLIAGSASGGDGGVDEVTADCGAQAVTMAEIHSGRVRSGVAVSVGPLVASSQKFLVSEAKSGSCLWGAFAGQPAKSGAGAGLFLVSFGAPHADGEACQPGSDGLPDDLRPGDALSASGMLDEYVPAACDGTAPVQQLRVDVACPMRRGTAGALPEPAVIDAALATRLAAGKDAQLLRDWGGALVRLDAVSALQDQDDGDAVFPFGVVRLEQTPLEVHSRLYYFDLSQGGPRASVKAPHYRYPTAFQSVTGLVFLDYCSWVLAPRDRCADLSPPSAGCR